MATKSKLELAVDAGKWEDGLRKAQNSMKAFEQSIGGLEKATSSEKEKMAQFIQILGNTKSTAATASQQVKEYRSTIERLQVISTKLNDEQKKLAEDAMAKLTKRMQEAKGQVDQLNQSMNETSDKGNTTGNVLDQLAGKFGLSTKQLTEFGAALAIGKTALDTMKGAMESNEATHDAYARTVEVCDAVTNQFLLDLANADFSNFISGLQSVIDKAIDAYNALDEFESYAARFNPAQQAQEAKIQALMQQARAAKAQGDNTRAEQLNNEAKALINQLEQTTKEYGQKQTTAGYATIRSKMGEVGITDQQIAWYADPKNWDKAQQKAKEFQRIQNEIQRDQQTLNSNLGWSDSAKKMYADADARLKANQQALRNDPSLKRAYTFQNLRDSGEEGAAFRQALGNIYGNTMSESRIESLRARADRMGGVITRGTSPKGSSPTFKSDISGLSDLSGLAFGSTESMKELNAELAKYKNLLSEAKTAAEQAFAQQAIEQVQKQIEVQPIALSLGVSTEEIVSVKDQIEKTLNGNPIQLLPIDPTHLTRTSEVIKEGAGDTAKAWQNATAAINNAGSAMQNMQDPAAKVAGIVMEAIANVALGFAQASASPATGAAGVFGWIAAATVGIATMTATIAQIKSATEYHAQGGIVGMGSSPFIPRGTDTVPAMLTPGEVVLNASQAQNVASVISEGRNNGGTTSKSIISGEQLVTVINAYGRRTGRGEILK